MKTDETTAGGTETECPPPEALPGDFLDSSSIRTWEEEAISACRAVAIIRQDVVVLWIVLAINSLIWLIVLGRPGISSELSLFAKLNLIGFGVALAVSAQAYRLGTSRWALATAIVGLFFSFAIITLIGAIEIIATLPRLRRGERAFSRPIEVYSRLRERLIGIFNGEGVVGWTKCPQQGQSSFWMFIRGSVGPFPKVKLFDNAAVFLVSKIGPAVVVSRRWAGEHPLVRDRKGCAFFTNYPVNSKPSKAKIWLSNDLAVKWEAWSATGTEK